MTTGPYRASEASVSDAQAGSVPAGWWEVRDGRTVWRTFGGPHADIDAAAYAADLNRAWRTWRDEARPMPQRKRIVQSIAGIARTFWRATIG